MDRRNFLQLAAAAPALGSSLNTSPDYKIVSRYARESNLGMPGRYPGQAVRVKSEKSINEMSGKIDWPTIRTMISQGMRELTGLSNAKDAWGSFFGPADVVGIKTNCSGAPKVCSSPEVVGSIVENLITVGVKPGNIWIYERFPDQLESVHYERYVPSGVRIWAAEETRGSILAYDPFTFVEVNFFGEDDTRSNLIRKVSEQFTKIINVPNMKDHGAAGVTGCLKNIAYGNFSNVARSHYHEKTNTLSFIGTLASVEPLRSRTVLNVMDGLRGVWHGGPFVKSEKFYFYPKQLVFGTDPVAMDRLLIDVVDNERKAQGAVSVWDRSMKNIANREPLNPNKNPFIREPGHIEYGTRYGLGVYDLEKIRLKVHEV